ncbi:SemiSWEET family sugar transporter [Chitinibacter tainanensis]|uniref:SemiSWEET family sugar transporter n=1 Tax=Chitinibacter tainanensis TaxID=230667 RepID=UPI002352ABCC|nr:PQ-loop domain-containing transporter [Chitinibacter tainanensis]
MPSPWLIQLANLLQTSVPFLSLCAYIPQWKKLIKTRSSNDISLSTWLIFITSASFQVIYAVVQWQIHSYSWPLLISTVSTLLCGIFTVGLIIRYRHPSNINALPQELSAQVNQLRS